MGVPDRACILQDWTHHNFISCFLHILGAGEKSSPLDLGQLKWESLKKRRKDNRLTFLYKGLNVKARIPTDDLIPKTRRGRNQHSLAFQLPSASKDAYQYSFFPQTIRDWNDLPESLISSSELSDYSVSKFTSLVRAMD